VEKRSSHYGLENIKDTFQKVSQLRMSRTARRETVKLGLTFEEVVSIIQSLKPRDCYKSMTSHIDHTIWQDVYHSEYNDIPLYIKFTTSGENYLIISFKRK
jgi:motility quorum-sensing regulator/GCU-specific mRNA interferase toxin